MNSKTAPFSKNLLPLVDPAMRVRVAFLTVPNYTLLALSSAIEALRMANRACGQTAYEWVVVSQNGEPARASCGQYMEPTQSLASLGRPDMLFVCGGLNITQQTNPELQTALRQLAQRVPVMGSLCTGGYLLAKAGLLDGYKAVIHWENMASLKELFPRVKFLDQVYVLDRDRYTCAGGVAPLDMMSQILRKHFRQDVGAVISEQFILDRVRSESDRQHVPLQARVGKFHENLIEAAAIMEANIEEPLSMDEISVLVGVSRRQMERLFQRYLGQVPTKYYLELRLQRARELLSQTSLTVTEIAVICGFLSPPHFSKCYRSVFGLSPSAERRLNHGPRAEAANSPVLPSEASPPQFTAA
jgi:transcriptional regulator GlxA family with amidase domain